MASLADKNRGVLKMHPLLRYILRAGRLQRQECRRCGGKTLWMPIFMRPYVDNNGTKCYYHQCIECGLTESWDQTYDKWATG